MMLTALINANPSCRTEEKVYNKLGLQFIPPEMREGHDEIELASARALPELIATEDICGELHAHTTSSDGVHTIEQMAEAALKRGYKYLGITDHSQSLTIAHGMSESDLWAQLRYIDRFNQRNRGGIRVLKSAEVDILEDGSLDYSDALSEGARLHHLLDPFEIRPQQDGANRANHARHGQSLLQYSRSCNWPPTVEAIRL